uniref:PLP-dependent cysteine synthase family protein n=1 Tax=uncultured Methanobrevibacter sp. TaxID=253161 RepID=UPI0025E6996F
MVNVPKLKRGVLDSIIDAIGNTPIVRLNNLTKDLEAEVDVKIESFNPTGSVKDRVAVAMIEDAEEKGQLKEGSTIIEPTSGNTGIGLALCGVRKGYKVIIVMPENMSEERKKIIHALGAELVLTPAELSVDGAVTEAERIASSSDQYFVPQQFKNPANPDIHYRTTAVELCEQLGQKIDIYVSGIGSGGTLQGVAKYLL